MERKILGEFHGIKGEIVNHQVWGTPANALFIGFPETRNVLSSREGFRQVSVVGNCYLPESLWSVLHARPGSWMDYLKEVLNEVNRSPDETAALSTGVNMEDFAWGEKVFEELWVTAFVTAGVKSNAMRIGKDRASDIERNGKFDKMGTINTILFTGASLDLATLAASFITITEAKNIALQELDVRSSYTPQWQATGTGTDQIIVVSGKGDRCTNVGGHSKLGELMAEAVTSTTICAIKKNLKVAG
ncbi:MAG: adenosylcobinamide amidohydrolase [Chloroflexi bacterium]|nr:adenosylcobinamide amidohydrolase [Chloroflexota bacterium]